MPVSLTGCCLAGCAFAADRLRLHTPLPAVRSDEHALTVGGGSQSQQGSPEPPQQRPAKGSNSGAQGSKANAAEASPGRDKKGQAPLRRLPVVLRVEVASKFSAQVLTWSVILLNAAFVWLALALLSLRQTGEWTVGQLRPYYQAELIIGAADLGIMLVAAAWFGLSVWSSVREERVWSKRQRYFAVTAAVLLVLQTCYSSAFVASYAIVLAADNCAYPFKPLAALEFAQWACFISILLFLLARLHNVMVYRGPGALDMHPDCRLVVDRPLSERPRQNKWILGAWVLLVLLGILNMVDKIRRYPDLFPVASCDAQLNDWNCPPNGVQIGSASVFLAVILLFVAYWLYSLYQATRDHELLPWHKYRVTHMFIRIQARVFGPVITAVVASTIFLGLVPAFTNSCWAAIDAQIGNMPVDLALSLAALIMSLLYAPKARALDSPMLQDFFQVFAWTQSSEEQQVERRNRQLLDTGSGSGRGGWPGVHSQVSFTRMVESAAAYLPGKLAQLAGVPDVEAAAAKLREEPCFCMETAVKLFYWMRLAYREDDVLEHAFVNASIGLELFDLHHFETIWDESTDTHCAVGWSDTTCVVAFRGTQTMQNVLTDLKAWMAPLQPETKHHGKLCKVHAGFLSAWLHHGFNEKVLARLREIDSGPHPLRFWVCGHSLGGALAVLAALQIRQQHPQSQLRVYTYGCPRVGNRAFSDLFDQTVPNCWAVVNDLDPIPWVPKWCFHRVGKRVIIDGRGNLILRPTYFEIAVTHRGASAKHHLTGSYALSFAAIFRAQFVPSKALPGGAQGVAALEAAVDLAKSLQLTNMDIESLRDPAKLPQLSEALAARQAQRRSGAGSNKRQLSRNLSCGGASFSLVPACCSGGPAVVGGREERRAAGMAEEGVEAPSSGWWCCSAAAPQQQAAAAARGSGSVTAAAAAQQVQQQVQQQQQDGERQVRLAEVGSPSSAAPGKAAAAADVAAAETQAAGTVAAQRLRPLQGPPRQRSFVHIKRFSTLLLRGSKSTAGSTPSGGAAAAHAAGGEQEAAAGGEGATAGQPTAAQAAAAGAGAEADAEPLPLHSALSHPDSIVVDEGGSWVHLPEGGGSGRPSMQRMASRRGSLRLDLR